MKQLAAPASLQSISVHRKLLWVAAASIAVSLLLLTPSLVQGGGPDTLLRTPADLPITAVVESIVGEVDLADKLGHDGKFFVVIADDPDLSEIRQWQTAFDNGPYRAMRILYPAMASAFGLLDGRSIVWGLFITNLLVTGAGAWLIGWWATTMGRSPWLGLLFPLDLGVVATLRIDAGDALGSLLLAAGALALAHRKPAWAAVALSGAVLSKESLATGVAGLVAWQLVERRKIWWSTVVAPAAAGLAWFAYVMWRSGDPYVSPGAFGVPIEGWFQAVNEGSVDSVVAVLLAAIMVVVTIRTVQYRHPLWFAATGAAAPMIAASQAVWTNLFDSARVLTLLILVFMLGVVIRDPGASQESAVGH